MILHMYIAFLLVFTQHPTALNHQLDQSVRRSQSFSRRTTYAMRNCPAPYTTFHGSTCRLAVSSVAYHFMCSSPLTGHEYMFESVCKSSQLCVNGRNWPHGIQIPGQPFVTPGTAYCVDIDNFVKTIEAQLAENPEYAELSRYGRTCAAGRNHTKMC